MPSAAPVRSPTKSFARSAESWGCSGRQDVAAAAEMAHGAEAADGEDAEGVVALAQRVPCRQAVVIAFRPAQPAAVVLPGGQEALIVERVELAQEPVEAAGMVVLVCHGCAAFLPWAGFGSRHRHRATPRACPRPSSASRSGGRMAQVTRRPDDAKSSRIRRLPHPPGHRSRAPSWHRLSFLTSRAWHFSSRSWSMAESAPLAGLSACPRRASAGASPVTRPGSSGPSSTTGPSRRLRARALRGTPTQPQRHPADSVRRTNPGDR